MNRKENEPPNHGYLLDKTVIHQQRYYSPDSDTASSAASVFSSDDGKSSSSSPSSSPVKSERSWNGEVYQLIEPDIAKTVTTATQTNTAPTKNNKTATVQANAYPNDSVVGLSTKRPRTSIQIQQLVNQEPCVPAPTNPRRTQSSSSKSVVCQTLSRGPPQLIRQCDRTQNFVENLVDTSTQMIEVIWPLSASYCDKDYLAGRNLIGLRTFIQEVLKRSKTSYYTLQVALYYLILIKPCVQDIDFIQQQSEITHAQRAMQCGRRMFLAALILASKYLQDRNYSARAWSKISGLKISEINRNEMAFLIAVDWKLHIPEPQFQRWSNIVYRYSTSRSPPSLTSFGMSDSNKMSWKQIIPRLTPELNEIDIEKFSRLSLINPPLHGINLPLHDGLTPQTFLDLPNFPPDGDKTPTPTTVRLVHSDRPPCSPRISALSTPALTPQIRGFCTPAARTWSTGQAMKETMQKIQVENFKSTTCDPWPKQEFAVPRKPLTKVMSNCSIISSPESMVSDVSTNSTSSRTSRSSSICSVASSVGARSGCHSMIPFASHRSTLASLNGSDYVPACVGRYEPYVAPFENYPGDAEMDATLALLHLASTDKRSSKKENCHKRARPLSVADNNISEEVRSLLSDSFNQNQCVVLPDKREANSFVLSRPELVKSSGSQIGARKKVRSYKKRALWAGSSPAVICLQ